MSITKYNKLTPLNDRIVVEPLIFQEEAGGIILPNADDKPIMGTVISVGRGSLNEQGKIIPLETKVGDVIMFGKYAGTKIEFNGKDLLIMKESDIQVKLSIINQAETNE